MVPAAMHVASLQLPDKILVSFDVLLMSGDKDVTNDCFADGDLYSTAVKSGSHLINTDSDAGGLFRAAELTVFGIGV